jgi:hypothetical protein
MKAEDMQVFHGKLLLTSGQIDPAMEIKAPDDRPV